jgi:hypothetical protein
MSEEKKRTISEQADDIRRELDELIGTDESITDLVERDPALPPARIKENVSFKDMKTSATKQAEKTITALMKFYLDEDIITKDEYVMAKKKMDEMTMSSLVYQLNAGERALTTLLETIEDGELAPRMFEVLATLQKSMLDIIKSQTMYLMATEESTKRIARDIEMYRKNVDRQEIQSAGGSTENGNVQRGTKDLMRLIRMGASESSEEIVENLDIDDAEINTED